MDDDLQKRLETQGRKAVPPMDPGFADRLESQLRVEHGDALSNQRRRVGVLLPRLVAAALIVVAGVVGVGALRGDDSGVPVAVVDGEPIAPLDSSANGGDSGDGDVAETTPPSTEGETTAVADSTAEPTPTAPAETPPAPAVGLESPAQELAPTATATPTQTPVPTVSPADAETATPEAVSTPLPATPVATPVPAVSTPTAIVTPSPTATSIPRPTATAAPVATPLPEQTAVAATPVVVPTPSATVDPTPTMTATVEPEPADIAFTCDSRVQSGAVGVVCGWTVPVVDGMVASYEIMRSLNGSDVTVVSQQRASAPLVFTDRTVDFGDLAIYLVQGLDADGSVVAASVRQVVALPTS